MLTLVVAGTAMPAERIDCQQMAIAETCMVLRCQGLRYSRKEMAHWVRHLLPEDLRLELVAQYGDMHVYPSFSGTLAPLLLHHRPGSSGSSDRRAVTSHLAQAVHKAIVAAS